MKPKKNKLTQQQRVDPFELPDPNEWDDEEEEEVYQLPVPHDPVRRPDPFEPIIDPNMLDDDLHDKWDWSSQSLYD